MKEVVFTAETRPARLAVVRRLTEHYERLNGVCPRILTPDDLDFASLPHPAWVKAYVWDLVGPDVERVTWIDSDTVCLRPMPPWPDAPFAAADDIPPAFAQDAQSPALQGLQRCFNAGVFTCTRDSKGVFERLKRAMHEPEIGKYREQSWLNVIVSELLGGYHPLPPVCNWLLPYYGPPPPACRLLHFPASGGRSDATLLAYLQSAVLSGNEKDYAGPLDVSAVTGAGDLQTHQVRRSGGIEKEVVFTAETRSGRLPLVRQLADEYERLNGIRPIVLTQADFDFSRLRSPHWIKAFLWDLAGDEADRITWIDSDAVCIRPLPPWPNAAFAAMDELTTVFSTEALWPSLGTLNRYFNSGVFSCTRASRPAFDRLKSMMEEAPGHFQEQGAFNLAVTATLGSFFPLAPVCNWLRYRFGPPPPSCCVLHLAGVGAKGDNELKGLING